MSDVPRVSPSGQVAQRAEAATTAREEKPAVPNPSLGTRVVDRVEGSRRADALGLINPNRGTAAVGRPRPGLQHQLEAYREEVRRVASEGRPVTHATTGQRTGKILGSPGQAVASTTSTARDLTADALDWNLATVRRGGLGLLAALLLPFTAIGRIVGEGLAFAGKVVDLPFRGVRALSSSFDGETEAPAEAASHRRVARDAWPTLELNRGTRARIEEYRRGGLGEYSDDVLVIPGYATDTQTEPLHSRAAARLDDAIESFNAGEAPFILVSGGNVHPAGTPHNEALEMRAYLLEHGIPADRILVEPSAEHSTTNLRNAGRMMRRLGLESAVVISTPGVMGQSFYFQNSDAPWGIHYRTLGELGFETGDLSRISTTHTRFVPGPDVDLVTLRKAGISPLDP